jgi:hypothetical protein
MKTRHLAIGISIAVILTGVYLLAGYYQERQEGIVDIAEIDYGDEEYTWNALIGTTAGDILVRGDKIDEIKHDIKKLIAAFNRSGKDPESFRATDNQDVTSLPKLKFIDLQIGIVTVEVINAEYLTQRMGTTGADAFMATATFTLTEHEDVNGVNFLFKEGDHAMPGVYSREIFKMYWVIRNGEDGNSDSQLPPSYQKKKPGNLVI